MAETKRTGIIDKDGGNILANVVESTATPGTYGLVALNPDGSDIGGPASAIVIGNPVVGGNPGRILYIDQAGNLFGDDAAVRDSGVQKQTTIGSGTYAQTNANDGVSAEVYFQADVIGDTGNSISLVFDGIDDADTVLNAWNTANPGNTASIVDGVGTTVPTAGTRPFMGGGEIIYESGTVNNGISTYFQGSGSTLLDTTNGKIGFSTTGNLISVIGEPSLGFVAAGIDSNTGNLGAMVVSDSGIDFFVTDQSTYNARLQGDDVEIILAYNGTYLGVNGLSGPLWGDSSSNRYILPTNVTPSVGDTLAVAGISGNDYALDFVGGGVTIGDAISGGSANEILFADGSTNVAQSTDLFYDDALKIFHVGDFGLAANKTYIALNDQNSKIDLQTTGTFKAGDIGSTGNDTLLTVDDNAKKIKLALGTHSYFQLQNGGFGTDNVELFGGSTVGSILMANDDNIISFINNSNTWFYMDYPNKQFSLGDVSGGSNGTKIVVDDNAKKITVTKPLGLQGYTVATLPTGFTGATAYVTDALAPTFGATVVGTGAVTIPVFYDGTNWIVG